MQARIPDALRLMERQIGDDVSIDAIASAVGLSPHPESRPGFIRVRAPVRRFGTRATDDSDNLTGPNTKRKIPHDLRHAGAIEKGGILKAYLAIECRQVGAGVWAASSDLP